MNVVVVHPDCLKQCREVSGKWIYADDDLGIYERVKRTLGPRSQPLIGPADFQAKAAGLRKEFVAWVDENLIGKPVYQWILTPLYKNPYSNNLFLHIAWLCVIDDVLKDQGSDLIVVTASLGFCETLRSIRVKSVNFRTIGFSRLRLGQWYRNVKAIGGTVKRLFELMTRMVLARWILGERHKQRLAEIDLLVAGYVHDADLSESGVFRDRYFPGLMDWYRRRGFSPAQYPSFTDIPFYRLPNLYRRIRSSATAFVVFELFLSFPDLFRAVAECLDEAFLKVKILSPFRGIDFNPLTRALKFRAELGGLVPVALTRAPRRLSEAGIHPKWLVTWFENQVPDKANIIGFSQIEPSVRMFAVRQYHWIPNLVSQYSTSAEVLAGVSPRENWVCGQAMLDADAYDSAGSYRVVPALRYSHLYREDQLMEEPQRVGLSVLLTFSVMESLGILTCVIEALSDLRMAFREIHVKPHPDVGVERMRSLVEEKWRQANHFVWESGSLDKLLNISAMVVSAGTNSAIEAICCGIPVVVIGRPAGLDMNPLEMFDQRLWRIVYDGQELKEAIAAWTPHHPIPSAERIKLGRAIRDAHFQRVSEETMMAFRPDFEDLHAPS